MKALEDKWLLISCLQKSIRKGYADLAVFYASKLFDLERNYLMYRLSIIAIEDIGLGNIDAVHNFMSTQLKKNNIEKLGGKDYILKIVREFAMSIKDRSAVELAELASFHTTSLNLSREDLEKLFIDDSKVIVNRMLAGWEILGAQKLKNALIINKNDNIERFIELNRKIVKDEKIIEIIENSYVIHQEPHFIALGLLSYLYQQEKGKKMGKYITGQYVEKKHEPLLLGEQWLIDGIDWHTKEGKSAIIKFCQEKTKIRAALEALGANAENLPQIIGMLLFRHCGHEVDKRLVYPSAVVILKLTEKTGLSKLLNNNKADYSALDKVFQEDFPLLREKIIHTFQTPDPQYFPF